MSAAARRLPGVSFVVRPPAPAQVLPRMDVGVFVGFTASGPLQTPVAVEDPDQFAAVFGADAPLAWDTDRGAMTYANLGPAVRAFFRNGGQRCWVVRVAGDARENWFPVPGLARLRGDGSVAPAFAPARSEGSWSDGLRVGAALGAEPVDVAGGANDLAPGDLLRLTYDADGYVRLLAVLPGEPTATSPPGGLGVPVNCGPELWLRPAGQQQPLAAGLLRAFAHDGPTDPIPATVSVPDWPGTSGDQTVTLDAGCDMADAPPPGSLVRVDFGADSFWLLVQDVRAATDGGSPLGSWTQLSGQGFWHLAGPPGKPPAAAPVVERLTFALWVRQGDDYPVRLDGLGCAAGQPSYWGALPADVQFYAADPPDAATTYADLWQAVAAPRFPLAGGADPDDAFSFPLGMALFPSSFPGPDPLPGTALERDGLADFGAGLFLGAGDAQALSALLDATTNDLLAEADFLRYQGPDPRPLQGIYAALALDEATLIAVPDAVHRGWGAQPPSLPAPPADGSSPSATGRTGFVPCVGTVVPAPVLGTDATPTADGNVFLAPDGVFSLEWTAPAGAASVLEEATRPDYTDAVPIYSGGADRFDVYGRHPGDYYYRASAAVAGVTSDWSKGVVVRVGPPGGWQVNGVAKYDPAALLVVQRALLRLCAARGDVLAVLALPGHYREDDALAHVARLVSPAGPILTIPLGTSGDVVASSPLGFGEAAALSYGAIYHPWPIGSPAADPEGVTPVPPDGPACGVLARRALTRGAWVAPANEALVGVVDLSPAVAPARLADLYAAQVNVFVQEARGFVAQGADTLAADADLRPINVRRLLSLLRRLALAQGPAYVFEPNDDALRRRVQQGFESLLQSLFVRGAFAGPTPATSFQVVTDASVNTAATAGQGQFVVELRVAPALPLTFLTVRLVQSGDRGSVTEVT